MVVISGLAVAVAAWKADPENDSLIAEVVRKYEKLESTSRFLTDFIYLLAGFAGETSKDSAHGFGHATSVLSASRLTDTWKKNLSIAYEKIPFEQRDRDLIIDVAVALQAMNGKAVNIAKIKSCAQNGFNLALPKASIDLPRCQINEIGGIGYEDRLQAPLTELDR